MYSYISPNSPDLSPLHPMHSSCSRGLWCFPPGRRRRNATPQGGHPHRSTPHPSGDAAYPRKYSNPQPCHHKHASIEGWTRLKAGKLWVFAIGQWMIFVKLGSGFAEIGLGIPKARILMMNSNRHWQQHCLVYFGYDSKAFHFITNTPASNWKRNPQFLFPLEAIGGTLTQEITREITWTNNNPRPSQQPGLKEKQLGSLPWKWNCPKKKRTYHFCCLQSNWWKYRW